MEDYANKEWAGLISSYYKSRSATLLLCKENLHPSLATAHL